MLECEECGTTSETGRRWRAMVGSDPDEDTTPFVVIYCPGCAAQEFGASPCDESSETA
jgi:hypothetical protein